jgi:outer membrane lipoprotein-sorting protein
LFYIAEKTKSNQNHLLLKGKFMFKMLAILSLICLASCAAGAATAAYAVNARTSDKLSASAEEKIVQRAKQETINELVAKGYLKAEAK